MKKNLILGLAIITACTLVSCKSSKSAYRQAYEKALESEQVQQQPEETVEVVPVTPVEPVVTDNSDLRSEKLTSVNGAELKAYNVVCGSFKSLANANNLCSTLKGKGYGALVAQNPDTGMYRVVAISSDSRSEAVAKRDQLRGTYRDAWLLYRTY